MSEERRRLLLVLLLVLLAVVAGWRLLPLLVADGGVGASGRRAPLASEVPEVRVAELDLGELAAEPRHYDPGRDPFSYYTPPPPPPPEPQGPTPEELAERAAAEAARRAAEAARQAEAERNPPPPRPPSFQLTYLGSFGPEHRKIAVFTDGEEIYNALVGDVIDDSFVVAEIGFESVTITYVGFPDEPGKRVAIGG